MGFAKHINTFNNNQQQKKIELIRKRLAELQQYQNMSKEELDELTSRLNNLLPKKSANLSSRKYKMEFRKRSSSSKVSDKSDSSSQDASSSEGSSEHLSPLHFPNGSNIPTGFTPCSIDGDGTCCRDKQQNGLISKFFSAFK